MDQWASRTSQGAYLNWIVGNAIIPEIDPDPSHEGIQKIDRTTVPELKELAITAGEVQTALENAEARVSPSDSRRTLSPSTSIPTWSAEQLRKRI